LSDLPEGIEISVITMTLAINRIFFIENILNFFPLNKKTILSIKSKFKIRTIIKIKKCKKISDNDNTNNFFNQITVIMNIPIDYNSEKTKNINIKLFKNGSIQISGLQSINQCNIAINKIISLLEGDYMYIENDTNKFFRYIEEGNIQIINYKINMINTLFKYSDKINRSQLYLKLLDLKLKNSLDLTTRIKYQPDIHAPVHIKIDLKNKNPVTGFIFESGNILIMAAKNRENIIDAYNYINQILTENHDFIIKRDLLQIIANDDELNKLIDLEALAQIINEL
jgi:TATA-box binding protein (TBP) (component of TFIID and TFIIIB)